MKPTFEQLTENITHSFLYRCFDLPAFDAPFHYHPELELTFIQEGRGKRFVGTKINDFEAGDMVFLGENVPHTWHNTEGGRSIVIQFKKDFVGSQFWQLPEMHVIQQLFEKAQAGILIKGKTKEIIGEKMQMKQIDSFGKLINLLEILKLIATSDEVLLIDPQFLQQNLSPTDNVRFEKIYTFLIENYKNDIELETIAAVAHLTPTSFCRYFKKITRKTLLEVVIELRIKHACQMLTDTEKSISDICFESGFGNLSHFNKEFKKEIGLNPLKYRKLAK